jgi:probable F420-dependent oxidoreductase
VVLDSDPAAARAAARAHKALYQTLPNYRRNLVGRGVGDDDFAAGASDRLVDAIVAWGGVEAVVARVQAHLAAGADHVCVQVLDPDPAALPMRQWRELAPALCAI